MSRVGKNPVSIPQGVEVLVEGSLLSVKGPKGALTMNVSDAVRLEKKEDTMIVIPRDNSAQCRSMWGTQRMLLASMVEGVVKGYQRTLEIHGVGYRAQAKGKSVHLNLGFSHEVVYDLPEGISATCPSATSIVLEGIDKQKVGQVAAEIRSFRPPEPYKGKGIRRAGEYVMRKEGKKK